LAEKDSQAAVAAVGILACAHAVLRVERHGEVLGDDARGFYSLEGGGPGVDPDAGRASFAVALDAQDPEWRAAAGFFVALEENGRSALEGRQFRPRPSAALAQLVLEPFRRGFGAVDFPAFGRAKARLRIQNQGGGLGVADIPGGGQPPEGQRPLVAGEPLGRLDGQTRLLRPGFVHRQGQAASGKPGDLGFSGTGGRTDVPLFDVPAQGLAGDGFAGKREDAGRGRSSAGGGLIVEPAVGLVDPLQLAQDGVDAAGAVDVLHVILRGRGHLAEAGDALGDLIDSAHVVLDARLPSDGESVEHGVGGAAHRHVQGEGVVEGGLGGNVPWFEVLADELEDLARGAAIEGFALLGHGQRGAVAGKRHAERLAEAVHRVGGEHARAGAASGAGQFFQAGQLLRREPSGLIGPDALEDADQVRVFFGALEGRGKRGLGVLPKPVHAGRHGAAADEDSGDVHPHRGHEHAGDDFVAVGDADHPVETMGAHHGFHAVGDQLPRGEGILHAAVAHGDAIVDADGVEHERHTARLADEPLDELADPVQMHVARHAIGVAVDDGDERLVEVFFRLDDARGPHQAAVRGAFDSFFDDV